MDGAIDCGAREAIGVARNAGQKATGVDLILEWRHPGGAAEFDWEAQGAPFKVVRGEGF